MMIMKNKNGIDVQPGRWYDFYNLQSGKATEVKKVTELVMNKDGTCDIVKVQGREWWDISSRWINWIISEHKD